MWNNIIVQIVNEKGMQTCFNWIKNEWTNPYL